MKIRHAAAPVTLRSEASLIVTPARSALVGLCLATAFGCGDVAPPGGSQLGLDGSNGPSAGGNSGVAGSGTVAPNNGLPGSADNTVTFTQPTMRNDGMGGAGGSSGINCMPNFTGVVRDFQFTHPDFESYGCPIISPGIVAEDLGADGKPVYNLASPNMMDGAYINPNPDCGQQTTSQADFDQWYRTTPGVNQEVFFTLPLAGQQGRLVYDNDAFFPIDGRGFGDTTEGHNFAFTFELHTTFTYQGGEIFTFVGDDDLWAFVNGKLAVDVGGLHAQQTGSVDLDAEATRLNLTIGQTYPLDLFHAERHTGESNFHVETNIVFTNCEPIFTPDVIR